VPTRAHILLNPGEGSRRIVQPPVTCDSLTTSRGSERQRFVKATTKVHPGRSL
jgi:hypothetical protein